MTLTYTDTDAIERRLKGRLTIGGPQQPYGNQAVDTDLLSQVGAQVEAKINAAIGSVYVLPLKLTACGPLLASLVEKGVICELADVHFFTSEEGTSFGSQMCRQFKAELASIVSQEIRLIGETGIAPSGDIRPNPNYVRARTPGVAEAVIW